MACPPAEDVYTLHGQIKATTQIAFGDDDRSCIARTSCHACSEYPARIIIGSGTQDAEEPGELASPPAEASPSAQLWREYPWSVFSNWTKPKLERSGIGAVIRNKDDKTRPCTVYQIDVDKQGSFVTKAKDEQVSVSTDNLSTFWDTLQVVSLLNNSMLSTDQVAILGRRP